MKIIDKRTEDWKAWILYIDNYDSRWSGSFIHITIIVYMSKNDKSSIHNTYNSSIIVEKTLFIIRYLNILGFLKGGQRRPRIL